MTTKTFGRPLEEEDTAQFGRSLEEPSPTSIKKDIPKQALIGGAKGLLGTGGDILDLLGLQSSEQLPGQEIATRREFDILEKMKQPGYKPSFLDIMSLSDDDLVPSYSRLPSSENVEEFAKLIGIETEPQTVPGKFARRIGEAVGGGASLGAGLGALGTLGLGAGIGEGVEQVTESPTAGIVAELLTSLGVPSLRGKLAPFSKKSKELVEAGRKLGLTEKEITPIIQSKRKLATFGKIAKKGGKTQETFEHIKEKLGGAYDTIIKKSEGLPPISLKQNEKLLEGFGKINKDLRTTLKAAPDKESAIKFIEESMENIRNRGTSPQELINFWQDINNAVNWNAIRGGKKSLGALKKPILEVIQEIDPALSKDFELTNKLYGRYKTAAKALKPDIIDKWLNKGEAAVLVTSIATGNPMILKGVASEAAARILSRELLTNPRLQNISNKALQAMRKNKGAAASQILRQTKKIISEKYPDEDWEFLDK